MGKRRQKNLGTPWLFEETNSTQHYFFSKFGSIGVSIPKIFDYNTDHRRDLAIFFF